MSNAAVLLDARHSTTTTTFVTGDKTKAAQAANHVCTPAAQVGAVRGMVSGCPVEKASAFSDHQGPLWTSMSEHLSRVVRSSNIANATSGRCVPSMP
jgi:hypothetical protein